MKQETTTRPTVVGLGEVLWDVFPDGPRFGGAPANFACSVAGLAQGSTDVFMVSAVGRDELGQRAIAEIIEHGVDAGFVDQQTKPTGKVLVQVDSKGHASYEFAAATAWDDLHWSDQLAQLAARTDAVCFGTLGQRSLPSRKTIRRFLESTPAECLRVFDVNLRSPHWTEAVVKESLPLANVLKCNEDELPRLASPFGLSGSDDAMLSKLIDQFNLRLVAFTRGSSGSIMMNHAGESSDLPGVDTTVVDTVGAGDSFTAAMTLGLLREMPLAAIHRWASRVSAFVCSRPGATPQLPAELCNSGSPGSMEDREP